MHAHEGMTLYACACGRRFGTDKASAEVHWAFMRRRHARVAWLYRLINRLDYALTRWVHADAR